MSSSHRSEAAMNLLSRMLIGVSETAVLVGHRAADESDFALDEIRAEDTTVSAKIFLPSGDVYHVRVSWDAEESP